MTTYFPILSPDIISDNITATISDHLPQFSFVPNILSNPSTQKSNYYERDWSKFKQGNFILDCFDKDWANLLQTDQQNVTLSLDSFLNNINSILDVHAPFKKLININESLRQNPGLPLFFRNQFLLKTTD